MAKIRLQKELQSLSKDESRSYWAAPIDKNDLFNWKASILGPDDSPYVGGVFFLKIQFPEDYPFKPPKMIFATKIYHPNINSEGFFCLPKEGFQSLCLHDGGLLEHWNPSYTISLLLEKTISLLRYPVTECPLVPEISDVLRTNKVLFDATAKEWTRKYARSLQFPLDCSSVSPQVIGTQIDISQNEGFEISSLKQISKYEEEEKKEINPKEDQVTKTNLATKEYIQDDLNATCRSQPSKHILKGGYKEKESYFLEETDMNPHLSLETFYSPQKRNGQESIIPCTISDEPSPNFLEIDQDLDPTEKAFKDNLANAGQLFLKGETQESLIAVNKALELQETAQSYGLRGGLLCSQGKYQEGKANLDKAIEMNPPFEIKRDLYLVRAAVCERLGQFQEMLTTIEELLKFSPFNIQGWFLKGKAHCKLKEYASAINCFDEILSNLDPKNIEAYYLKAQCLVDLKKIADAILWCDKAIEITDGSHPEFLLLKGVLLDQLGKTSESQAAFKQANKAMEKDLKWCKLRLEVAEPNPASFEGKQSQFDSCSETVKDLLSALESSKIGDE